MYDYLAKIILLGPSGSGKCVACSFACVTASLTTRGVLGPVCCTDLSRMNGVSCLHKQ